MARVIEFENKRYGLALRGDVWYRFTSALVLASSTYNDVETMKILLPEGITVVFYVSGCWCRKSGYAFTLKEL